MEIQWKFKSSFDVLHDGQNDFRWHVPRIAHPLVMKKKGSVSIGFMIPATLLILTAIALVILNQARL
jgi:hypothetical protein